MSDRISGLLGDAAAAAPTPSPGMRDAVRAGVTENASGVGNALSAAAASVPPMSAGVAANVAAGVRAGGISTAPARAGILALPVLVAATWRRLTSRSPTVVAGATTGLVAAVAVLVLITAALIGRVNDNEPADDLSARPPAVIPPSGATPPGGPSQPVPGDTSTSTDPTATSTGSPRSTTTRPGQTTTTVPTGTTEPGGSLPPGVTTTTSVGGGPPPPPVTPPPGSTTTSPPGQTTTTTQPGATTTLPRTTTTAPRSTTTNPPRPTTTAPRPTTTTRPPRPTTTTTQPPTTTTQPPTTTTQPPTGDITVQSATAECDVLLCDMMLRHTPAPGADLYQLRLLGLPIVLNEWTCAGGGSCPMDGLRLPLIQVLEILFDVVALDDGSILARSGGFLFDIL